LVEIQQGKRKEIYSELNLIIKAIEGINSAVLKEEATATFSIAFTTLHMELQNRMQQV
jgi:hypothetical protein